MALAKPNASDAALRTALASASSAGNTMAKEVVKAASAPLVLDGQNRLPIGGVALLAVLGEALGPLSTQLDDLSTFHDFACTFRDCRPPVQRSPLAQAYSLLGTLHSRSSMGALLPVTKDGLDGWKNVFTSLNEQRSKLDSALEALGQPDLPTANTSKIPVAVQSLARSLRNARERTQRFEATGMFQPSAKTLDSGLDQDTRRAIAATLNGKLGHLQTQANLYQNGALRVVVWVDFDVFIGAAAYR